VTLIYPFTEADSQTAYEEWGANCGPNALAFALQLPLSTVRHAIPDFEAKRYTSPTMMKAALSALSKSFTPGPISIEGLFYRPRISLVRIQWLGPWTVPGMNPKWAYRQTHWIATWADGDAAMVFDVNGGVRTFDSWKSEIVPALTAAIPRADGGWRPTHVWRLAGI
jgi:hypothetical protein